MIFQNYVTAQAYQRIIDEMAKIETALTFARHDRFGWLTVCPSHIGASLRISAALKLNNARRLPEICEKYGLCASRDDSEVVTISNRSAFGHTEYECIRRVWDGVAEIISEQLIPLEMGDDASADEAGDVAEVVDGDDVLQRPEHGGPGDEEGTAAGENEVVAGDQTDDDRQINDASFVISRDDGGDHEQPDKVDNAGGDAIMNESGGEVEETSANAKTVDETVDAKTDELPDAEPRSDVDATAEEATEEPSGA